MSGNASATAIPLTAMQRAEQMLALPQRMMAPAAAKDDGGKIPEYIPASLQNDLATGRSNGATAATANTRVQMPRLRLSAATRTTMIKSVVSRNGSQAALTAEQALAAQRFGYGASPDDVNALRGSGSKNWLKNQLTPALRDGLMANMLTSRELLLQDQQGLAFAATGAGAGYRDYCQGVFNTEIGKYYLGQITSNAPFLGRLAYFWATHFGIIGGNISLGTREEVVKGIQTTGFFKDICLGQALGNFGDMLIAATHSDLMMRHLNGSYDATITNPIQNFARELLQIFTVSADPFNYTVKNKPHPMYGLEDIQEIALFLGGRTTSMTANQATYGNFSINTPWLMQPGAVYWNLNPRAFLPNGRDFLIPFMNYRVKSYFYNTADVPNNIWMAGTVAGVAKYRMDQFLRALAEHPATAMNVCRRLIEHFITADSKAAIIRPLLESMVDAWMASKGNLPNVYRAMIDHPLAFSRDNALPAIVLNPEIWAITVYRSTNALNAPAIRDNPMAEARNLALNELPKMSYDLWQPPDVQGWANVKNDFWLTPGGMMARLDFTTALAGRIAAHVNINDFYRRAIQPLQLSTSRSNAPLSDPDPLRALATLLLMPELQTSGTRIV